MSPVDEPDDDDVLVHNWVQEAPLQYDFPDEGVVFWDETLRDGEQTPGVYFTRDEKVELAKLFDELGMSILHVGIPAVSDHELEAVKAVAEESYDNASILGGARTLRSDIDACIEAGVDECSPFVAASPVHREYKLEMSKDEIVDAAVDSVQYAKDHGLKTTFVTEDTVRTELDFVVELYNAAAEAGADRLLFCDTVGVMTPKTTKWWFEEIEDRGVTTDVEWGFHNHDDFGLGTANALAAFEVGVPVLNTTVNGLGERAGNVAFEEVVLALEDLYGIDTGIDLSRIHEASQRVEELTGVPIGISKPVVGYNTFTHESGIHTHGVLAHTLTYEPIQPEEIGRDRRFVFGKHTGTAAVKDRLERNGIEASKEELTQIADKIKDLTEERPKKVFRQFIEEYREWDRDHKGATAEEFWGIVEEVTGEAPDDGDEG